MKRGRKPGSKLSPEARKSFKNKMREIFKRKQAQYERECGAQMDQIVKHAVDKTEKNVERTISDVLRELERGCGDRAAPDLE